MRSKNYLLKKIIGFWNPVHKSDPGSLYDLDFGGSMEPNVGLVPRTMSGKKKPKFHDGQSDYPNYSYYTHIITTTTMEKCEKAAHDVEHIFRRVMLDVHRAMVFWMGKPEDSTKMSLDHYFVDTSFTSSLDYLRDLLGNLSECDPALFWDRGQLTLMLKLVVPLLFEIRSLRKTVRRIRDTFREHMRILTPVFRRFSLEDFAGEPRPTRPKMPNFCPSLISVSG